jgi:hypothetical protein
MIRSMSWVFTGVLKRVRNSEREQARRLNEAYARWHEKHRKRQSRIQERRLLGTPDNERNHHREA